jgi:hypothetical protein
MKTYRTVPDNYGDKWLVVVAENGGPYRWLPIKYQTAAEAEAAIVRLKQADAAWTSNMARGDIALYIATSA